MSLLKIKAFSIDTTDTFTFANANITTTLNGNIANFSGNITGANANLGNLVVANYFSGNGSLLTGIVAVTANYASYAGNVTVAAQPNITSVGTLTSLAVTGNVTTGNVSGTTGTFTTVAGTLSTAAQPNITSVGTLTGLTVNGDITSTGNLIVAGTTTYVNSTVTAIKDPIIELGAGANNAALTSDDGMDRGSLLHYYTGGATRDAFMGWKNSTGEFTFASNVTNSNNVVTINQLGNIKAGNANLGNLVVANYFSGNGSSLSAITGANVTGTVANATYAVTAGSATTAGTVTTAAQPNITSVGTLTSLAVTGNVTAGNISAGSITTSGSSGNISGANVISANLFVGSGASLSSITGANVTGTVASATVAASANSVTGANVSGQVANALVAGTVYTAAQPNITSVGTLTSVSVTGNVTAGGILTDNIYHANGAVYSFMTVSGSNTQVQFNDGGAFGASANFAFNKTSNTLTVTNIVANGSGLTSITGANVTGTVANATYATSAGSATTAGTVTTAAQPNITSVGTLTSVSVSGTTNLGAVGNVTITGGSSGYVLKTDGAGVLSWVAQKALNSAVDEFTGDGATVAYTLSVTPTSKNYTFVSVQGVMQPKSSYSVSGAVLTFSSAPPNTSLVEVTTLGLN